MHHLNAVAAKVTDEAQAFDKGPNAVQAADAEFRARNIQTAEFIEKLA